MNRAENYRNPTKAEYRLLFEGYTIQTDIDYGYETKFSPEDAKFIALLNSILTRNIRSHPDKMMQVKRDSDGANMLLFVEGKAMKNGGGYVKTLEPVQLAWNKLYCKYRVPVVYAIVGVGVFPACCIPFTDIVLPSLHKNPDQYMLDYQNNLLTWLDKFFNVPKATVADFSKGSPDAYVHIDVHQTLENMEFKSFFDFNFTSYQDKTIKPDAKHIQETLF